MADISKELEQIKKARYGRDVRGSIHDAINAVNSSAVGSALAAEKSAEASETSAQNSEASAQASETSAQNSEASAQASETSAQNSEASAEAAKKSEDKAKEYADVSKQAVSNSGFIKFKFSERGHLLMTKVNADNLSFRLNNGRLEVGI